MYEVYTASPAQTERAAAALADKLRAGDVVALYGGLGAGKTAFVRGLAAGMGLSAAVSSPTFALVHEYGTGQSGLALVHFDMYRVAGWDDLYSTGWDDYTESGAVLAVEWSERIEAVLPENAWRVEIAPLEDGRRRIVVRRGPQDAQQP